MSDLKTYHSTEEYTEIDMTQIPLELVNKIIMMREKHPIVEMIKELRNTYEEDTVGYYRPPDFDEWVFGRILKSQQFYSFKHPVDNWYAYTVIEELETMGYDDIQLDLNEDNEIVGIYGVDVNEKVGKMAERMFIELQKSSYEI